MAFLNGLKNDALADDAGIEPHKILGLLGAAGLVGKTYYVDSTHSRAGATQRHGTRAAPFSKLSWAVTNLSAANLAKATFILLPGHTETLTATSGTDLDIDAAGVNVIGIGVNAYQPTIKTSTATSSRVNVSGANCSITNVRFETAIDSCARLLYVTGAGLRVDSCLFIEGSAMQTLDYITLTTGADYARITNCEFMSVTAGAQSAITIGTTLDRVRVTGCWIHGNFSNAPIYSTSIHTHCLIADNFIQQLGTTVPIRFTAAATGLIAGNLCGIATALAARTTNSGLDIGSCYACENYVSDSEADTSGLLTPVANTH